MTGEEKMTYRHARTAANRMMFDAGIDDPYYDTMALMEYACGMDRQHYLMNQTDDMPEQMQKSFFDAVKMRCERIPLQQIIGTCGFMGLEFKVNENVLTPRQDTECLVEEALKILKGISNPKVLDMCTGSGCIAISVKHYAENALVSGCDISEKALETANDNASLNKIKISFAKSNLFDNIEGRFDMIISNPPYICSSVIDTLMPEVRDHEPRLALDGDEDGLKFYRKIITDSRNHLKNDGWLLFEIGADQGESVPLLMKDAGFLDVRVLKDLAGLDRVVEGRMNNV